MSGGLVAGLAVVAVCVVVLALAARAKRLRAADLEAPQDADAVLADYDPRFAASLGIAIREPLDDGSVWVTLTDEFRRPLPVGWRRGLCPHNFYFDRTCTVRYVKMVRGDREGWGDLKRPYIMREGDLFVLDARPVDGEDE